MIIIGDFRQVLFIRFADSGFDVFVVVVVVDDG